MNRESKINISSLLPITGWLLAGIGFTIKTRHPINTALLLLGLLIFFGGFIWLIVSINSKIDYKS